MEDFNASLEGKVALVTGAAAGQGEAEARLFTAQGAAVVIADIVDADGEALAAELGDRTIYQHLDVTRPDDWAAAVARARESFGGIDILINNAGGTAGISGPIETTTLDDYEFTIALNQTGPWLGIQAVAATMRERGGGSIVNVSSLGGFVGLPGIGAYSAAKWALRGISRTAAVELAPDGIRVNTIHPGFIDTPGSKATGLREIIAESGEFRGLSVPLGRAGEPIDIARVAFFLASDLSGYCTAAEFVVDGGVLAGGWPRM